MPHNSEMSNGEISLHKLQTQMLSRILHICHLNLEFKVFFPKDILGVILNIQVMKHKK